MTCPAFPPGRIDLIADRIAPGALVIPDTIDVTIFPADVGEPRHDRPRRASAALKAVADGTRISPTIEVIAPDDRWRPPP